MILNGIKNIWGAHSLAEHFEILTGTTPSTKNSSFWTKGEIVWITPTDLSAKGNNIFIFDSERKITQEALNKTNLSLLPENSFILSTRAPVGYVAINSKPITFNQGCKALVAKDSKKTFSKFYYYYFLHIKAYLQSISGGSTFKELSKNSLKNLNIPLPLEAEQKAIAEILSTVDEAIQKANEAIKKTERIKQGVLHKLLTGGIRHGGQVGHTEFKETKVGRIPKEWTYGKFEKHVNVLGGFAFKSTDYVTAGIPLLRISNVSFGEVVFDDLAFLPKSYLEKYEEYKIVNHDILLALTRPIISGGLKAAVVNSTRTPALLNQRVAKLNTKEEKILKQSFLKHFVLSDCFYKQMLQSQTCTNQPNVSTKQIENFYIIIPSPDEQIEIIQTLDSLQERYTISLKRKQKLERIKQGLMDDLLTGKKRVPASMLRDCRVK